MGLLLAFNGYLTMAGLFTSAIGTVVQMFEPEIGKSVQDTGLIMAGVGGARKGVKQYQGKDFK